MTSDEQQRLARTFLSVLRSPDADVIRQVAIDDIIWSFPGSSAISGVTQGVDGVMRRARTIAGYGVNVEIGGAVFGHAGVALFLHNTAARDGCELDEHLAAVFTFSGDRIARLDTYLSDVPMLESFFGTSEQSVSRDDQV
jgi:ketosteroid isomerase-like protein